MPLSHSLTWGGGGDCSSETLLNDTDHIQHHRAEPVKRKLAWSESPTEPVLVPQPPNSAAKRLCLWPMPVELRPQHNQQDRVQDVQESLPGCLKDRAPALLNATAWAPSSQPLSCQSSCTFPGSNSTQISPLEHARLADPTEVHMEEESDQSTPHLQHIVSTHQTTSATFNPNSYDDGSCAELGYHQPNTTSEPIAISVCRVPNVEAAATPFLPSGAMMDSEAMEDGMLLSPNLSQTRPTTPPQSEDVRCKKYDGCSGLRPSPVTGRLRCHCYASWRGMYGYEMGYCSDYY